MLHRAIDTQEVPDYRLNVVVRYEPSRFSCSHKVHYSTTEVPSIVFLETTFRWFLQSAQYDVN